MSVLLPPNGKVFHGTNVPKLRLLPMRYLYPSKSETNRGVRGEFVFATRLVPLALLHSVKLKEFKLLDGVIKDPSNDEFIPILVVKDREKYLSALKNRKTLTVEFNSEHFDNPYKADLSPIEVCRMTRIKISIGSVKKTKGIDEAMHSGVQVFSYGGSRDDWYELRRKHNALPSVGNTILKEFIANMFDTKQISWENQVRGINPTLG